MHRYEFQLRISAGRYLDYYRGTVRLVLAECSNGQKVQFPAALLQRFVTQDGICGNFVLICDDLHKHSRIERQAVETGFEQRQLPAIRFAQIRVPTVIVAGNYARCRRIARSSAPAPSASTTATTANILGIAALGRRQP